MPNPIPKAFAPTQINPPLTLFLSIACKVAGGRSFTVMVSV